jgi:cell wall assembly regulator SMI1
MLGEILDRLGASTARDDYGEPLVRLRAGLERAQMESLERTLGLRLPRDYAQFLARTDGCELFGLTLMCASEVRLEYYANERLLPFHNWGNGDFDCIDFRPRIARPIVFMNHAPEVTVRIARSFEDWLVKIERELTKHGDVAHPRDYRNLTRRGVYEQVLKKLRGVHCELNRD